MRAEPVRAGADGQQQLRVGAEPESRFEFLVRGIKFAGVQSEQRFLSQCALVVGMLTQDGVHQLGCLTTEFRCLAGFRFRTLHRAGPIAERDDLVEQHTTFGA